MAGLGVLCWFLWALGCWATPGDHTATGGGPSELPRGEKSCGYGGAALCPCPCPPVEGCGEPRAALRRRCPGLRPGASPETNPPAAASGRLGARSRPAARGRVPGSGPGSPHAAPAARDAAHARGAGPDGRARGRPRAPRSAGPRPARPGLASPRRGKLRGGQTAFALKPSRRRVVLSPPDGAVPTRQTARPRPCSPLLSRPGAASGLGSCRSVPPAAALPGRCARLSLSAPPCSALLPAQGRRGLRPQPGTG